MLERDDILNGSEESDAMIDSDLFYMNKVVGLFQLHPTSAVQAYPYTYPTVSISGQDDGEKYTVGLIGSAEAK